MSVMQINIRKISPIAKGKTTCSIDVKTRLKPESSDEKPVESLVINHKKVAKATTELTD